MENFFDCLNQDLKDVKDLQDVFLKIFLIFTVQKKKKKIISNQTPKNLKRNFIK